MLKDFFETASSIIFPVECETCKAVLSPLPPLGVCARCESEIKILRAPHCATCGRTLANDGPKCAECYNESFHFDRAFACALYEGKMKELLHAYKFGRRKYLKNFFLKIMSQFVHAYVKTEHFDAVAAVPIDPKKKRERGFNQSELLSKKLAARLKLPHASRGLSRTRSSSPQSLLSKQDRKQNVQGCFLVKAKESFREKRVLLIDDILTTGQTASECARILKEAGARSVTLLACARGF